MSQFEIVREAERLTLTVPMERRLLMLGCPLFLLAFASVLLLGILCVLQDAHTAHSPTSVEPLSLFSPHVNHFGFLWLLSSVLISILVPLYVFWIGRDSQVFTFDRAEDRFMRHGKMIAPLRKIEHVQMRRSCDGGSRTKHALYLSYLDGHEMFIEESHDEGGMERLAQALADFVGVPVVGSRNAVRIARRSEVRGYDDY